MTGTCLDCMRSPHSRPQLLESAAPAPAAPPSSCSFSSKQCALPPSPPLCHLPVHVGLLARLRRGGRERACALRCFTARFTATLGQACRQPELCTGAGAGAPAPRDLPLFAHPTHTHNTHPLLLAVCGVLLLLLPIGLRLEGPRRGGGLCVRVRMRAHMCALCGCALTCTCSRHPKHAPSCAHLAHRGAIHCNGPQPLGGHAVGPNLRGGHRAGRRHG